MSRDLACSLFASQVTVPLMVSCPLCQWLSPRIILEGTLHYPFKNFSVVSLSWSSQCYPSFGMPIDDKLMLHRSCFLVSPLFLSLFKFHADVAFGILSETQYSCFALSSEHPTINSTKEKRDYTAIPGEWAGSQQPVKTRIKWHFPVHGGLAFYRATGRWSPCWLGCSWKAKVTKFGFTASQDPGWAPTRSISSGGASLSHQLVVFPRHVHAGRAIRHLVPQGGPSLASCMFAVFHQPHCGSLVWLRTAVLPRGVPLRRGSCCCVLGACCVVVRVFGTKSCSLRRKWAKWTAICASWAKHCIFIVFVVL